MAEHAPRGRRLQPSSGRPSRPSKYCRFRHSKISSRSWCSPRGTGNEFAAADLPDQVHLPPHIAAVQVEPVAMRIDARHRLAEQLAEQNIGERLEDRRRRALEQVADADVQRPSSRRMKLSRIGKAAELHAKSRRRRARFQIAENAGIDLFGRLKKSELCSSRRIEHPHRLPERTRVIHSGSAQAILSATLMRYSRTFRRDTLPKAKITALGCYTPPRVLTNQISRRWSRPTTSGLWSGRASRERHIADPEVATSDLAVEAARCALATARHRRHGPGRHHRLHGDAGHAVPLDRLPGAERLGRARRVGLRPDRGLLRLRLRADDRRAPGGGGNAPQGAGDRRRHHEPDHRLHRPRDLRAVRRRRRRHAAGTSAERTTTVRVHRFPGRGGRLGRAVL